MIDSLRMATVPARYWCEGVLYRSSRDRDSIRSLDGSFAGSPLLIVGNGPSLRETPMDEFEGVSSIGMNKIDLYYDKTTWRPSLVVATNNVVIKQHWQAMLAAGVPAWLARKARYFVPRTARQEFNWFHVNAAESFTGDLTTGLGSSATVTYAALQIAYHSGADPVILVGVDHSFSVGDSAPNRYEKLDRPDVNHFDPSYFSNQWWGTPDLEASERSYVRARRAFDQSGRRIYDATVGGQLRVFDRIGIDEALQLVGT